MKIESFLITTSSTNPGSAQILFEGLLTTRNAAAIKNALTSNLKSCQNLNVVLKNITKIDLAVLQLLIALQKSMASVNKKLLIQIELSEYINTVIQCSGLGQLFLAAPKSMDNEIH